jgi:hypothetical protein
MRWFENYLTFEIVPELVLFQASILHEFDEPCEVIPHVINCPLLVNRHLFVERGRQKCMRLPHFPQLLLHLRINKKLVPLILQELFLIVQSHPQQVRVAPLSEILFLRVKEFFLFFGKYFMAVIVLFKQLRDASLHLADSLTFKRYVLKELRLISLEEIGHFLELGPPVRKCFH